MKYGHGNEVKKKRKKKRLHTAEMRSLNKQQDINFLDKNILKELNVTSIE